MSDIGLHIVSLMGVVSIACLLIAMILLLHMIQQAFARSGVVWGLISIVYPPGTYFYCRRNWEQSRSRFILISGLFIIALVFGIIVRVI